MRGLVYLTAVAAAGCSGTAAVETHEYRFIAPKQAHASGLVFDQSNGCIAQVNMPPNTDWTGVEIEGKALSAEDARQTFGMVYISDWTCPKAVKSNTPRNRT